jgi:iron complex transport system permease protein
MIVLLLALLSILFFLSLLAGRVWIPPSEVFSGLFSGGTELSEIIIFELRLPRAVLAVVIGASLGMSGAVLQGLTRNPLAEPFLLGVSAGASLGAVIAIYFGLAAMFAAATPFLGIVGAFSATAITFALGRGGGTLALILAGAAVSGLGGALIALSLNLAPNANAAYEIMNWLMGSLSDRSWDHVFLVLPFVLIGGAILISTGRALDALSLGETQAQSLGVDLLHLRLLVLFGTAIAVGSATSVAGVIGFIGLVAPHLIRPWTDYQPSHVIIPAALAGAVLLLGADIATRIIHIGPELKLGVFTSLIGTPFFFWHVVKLRKTAP